ncbi:hypothetical protein HNY73_023244 [Argiope bruennichi]|uniref:Uncharacterized protein n=1 Tax=Argiope bruennichi TaxID=94029 RepID=A0A8T0E491_ARGBR|nr:hypothetical protein HNY73_023244 [Argiope bruennichi]
MLSQAVLSVALGKSSAYDNAVSNAVWTILGRSGVWNAGKEGSLASSCANCPLPSQHPQESVASLSCAIKHPRVKAAASAFKSASSQSASRGAARSGAQSSSTTTTTSTSGSQAASQSASSAAAQASASSFAQASSASLAASSAFSSAFSSANSLSALGNVGYQLGFNVANTLGIGNAPGLGNALSQAVSSVGVGASSRAYANAVSNAVGQFLAGQGVLNAGNAGSLASSFANALSASAASVASSAAAQSAFQSQAAASAFSRAASQSASQSAARSGAQSSSPTTPHPPPEVKPPATSSAFSSAFSSANSLSALGNVGYQLGFNVANTLGIGNAPGLGNALSQAVSSVGVGASSSAYANAVSNAVGQFLAGQGVLNAGNAGSLASSFANALSNSALSVGSRVSSPSYGALSPIAAGPNFISTGLNVGGASVGGPFDSLSQSLPTSLQTALAPIVSSSGLGSSAATARVSSLANSFASAISSSGGSLSVPTFLNLLSSVGAQVSSTGSLSSLEVTNEVLLEAIAALLQVINGGSITSVDLRYVPNAQQDLVNALSG